MMNKLVTVLVIGTIALAGVGRAAAQTATWGGGDGNWTDANWSGGGGPDGAPVFGDGIILPSSTGTLSVTTDLFATEAPYAALQHQGGILQINATGNTGFFGEIRVADGAGAVATVNVDGGELDITNNLIIGYGTGAGASGSTGTVNISGSALVTVLGNLDTFFDPGAMLSVTGPDADVSVLGNFFFVGTGATVVANINADSHSPIKVSPGTAAIQAGQSTLEVNFVDGYVPTPGTSWTVIDAANVTGSFVNENLPDIPGGVFSVNYEAGGDFGEVVTVDFDNVLNLKVDLVTGRASIENPFVGGNDVTLDSYSIQSASGSLDPDGFEGFSGLGDANWQIANPTANALSELNPFSSTTVMTGESFDMGEIFGSPPVGDATGDGNVNIEDLNAVRNNFGSGDGSDLSGIPGDTFPRDGFVDINDLNNVRNNFGNMGSSGTQDLVFEYGLFGAGTFIGTVEYVTGGEAPVPEPSSLALLLAGALVLPLRRGRKA